MESKELINKIILGSDEDKKKAIRIIKKMAKENGIWPDSTYKLYKEIANGKYGGFTVPAINVRTLTYDAARAVLRVVKENNIGPFIFELARSEIKYTDQPTSEYVHLILAAALKENYKGPLFFQGDHYQVKAEKYFDFQKKNDEIKAIEDLIKSSIDAGIYNIDIDASTLVALERQTIHEQQLDNSKVTAKLTSFIRSLEPGGIAVSVGGEIGEVGGKNSTLEELEAFFENYQKELFSLSPRLAGLSKISVQTGASHGGVVLPNGEIKKINIDFDTLEKLSTKAREYGMAGAVQHGASTLPEEYFDKFPKTGTCEIHLATEFQNIIYDSPHFPEELKEKVYNFLKKELKAEWEEGWNEEQFLYKTRKKGLGPFKKEIWGIPEKARDKISQVLEEKFSILFEKLGIYNTSEIIKEVYSVKSRQP